MEKDKKGAKQDLSEILQFVAPGTPLREGIEKRPSGQNRRINRGRLQ